MLPPSTDHRNTITTTHSGRQQAHTLRSGLADAESVSVGTRSGYRGFDSQVPVSPSVIKGSHSCSSAKRPCKETGSFGRNRHNVGQMGSGNSSRDGSRILFPSFCCNKEIRGVTTCNQLEDVEHFSYCPSFQNGNCAYHSCTTPSRGVCNFPRHERCLFSCRCSQVVQKIHEILCRGESLPIQSDVFWAGHSSKNIHDVTSTTRRLSKKRRHKHTHVSGRLAHQSRKSRKSYRSRSESPRRRKKTRHSDKSCQVRIEPQTRLCLPRGQVQSQTRESVPNRRESDKDSCLVEVPSSISEDHSTGLPITVGSVESHQRFSDIRQAPSSSSPVLSEMLLEGEDGPSHPSNTFGQNVLQSSRMVGARRESQSRGSVTSTGTISHNLDRCEPFQVGGALGEPENIRNLVPNRSKASHKSVGIKSCNSNTRSLQTTITEQDCIDYVGQYNGSVPHKETRGNALVTTVSTNTRIVCTNTEAQHFSQSHIHSRSPERDGGPAEPQGSDSQDRMDSVNSDVQSNSISFPFSGNRPVRNLLEQQTSSVCEPGSRRSSLGNRCPVVQLGEPHGLRISSNQPDCTGPEESRRQRLSDTSNSSQLADSTLVSDTVESTSRVPNLSTTTQTTAPSASVSGVSLQTRNVKSSRVALIKSKLLQEGFSEAVAEVAAKPQRKSSLSVYQSHFAAFTDWCRGRNISLERVSIANVADYLYFLFSEKQREVATIASHRTALSAALGTFDGFTVGDHPVLSNLISGLYIQRPPNRLRVPEWNLMTVLNRLMEAPFEPPKFDTIFQRKMTTWKTVFLLALACAKRASELHAISRDPADLRFDQKGVFLRFVPQFQAKTQRVTSSHRPFYIPKLDVYTGRDSPDRKLCPVRMLKFYLNFTGGHLQNSRLFVKCRGEGAVLSKTISSWLKNVITHCHSNQVKAKGHEVRRIATSWSLASGAAVTDILEAASWSNSNTFTSYYLVDVQRQMDGRYRLCPVVPGGPRPGSN